MCLLETSHFESRKIQSVVRGEQHVWFAMTAGEERTTDSETIKTSWALQDFGTF